MKVFVIDSNGKPCLPTKPRRAKQLLNQGKAVVKQVIPFTIQLKKKIEDPVGEFEVGVDDGTKYVGVAIKNSYTNEIVFHAEIKHRNDVKRLVKQRSDLRNKRRSRIRYRKPRFKNRTKKNVVPPSIRQKKDVVVRFLNDFRKRLNIINVTVEEVACKLKEMHKKQLFIASLGKSYLKNILLNNNYNYYKTSGFITKETRLLLGLPKKHSFDACSVLNSNLINCKMFKIQPRRSKIWENNPSKKCSEKNGFKHYDVVKSIISNKIIIGSVCALGKDRLYIRIEKLKTGQRSRTVSYKKSKLLQRPKGLIYTY